MSRMVRAMLDEFELINVNEWKVVAPDFRLVNSNPVVTNNCAVVNWSQFCFLLLYRPSERSLFSYSSVDIQKL